MMIFPHAFGAIFRKDQIQDLRPGTKVPFTLTGTIKTRNGNIAFDGTDYVRVIGNSRVNDEIQDVSPQGNEMLFANYYNET